MIRLWRPATSGGNRPDAPTGILYRTEFGVSLAGTLVTDMSFT